MIEAIRHFKEVCVSGHCGCKFLDCKAGCDCYYGRLTRVFHKYSNEAIREKVANQKLDVRIEICNQNDYDTYKWFSLDLNVDNDDMYELVSIFSELIYSKFEEFYHKVKPKYD